MKATPIVAGRLLAAITMLALGASTDALAQERTAKCRDSGASDGSPPVLELRVDNDLFANQDQGYTSGVALSLISPNLANYRQDQCLPAPARWLNRYLEWLQPHGFDQQNMVVRLDHRLYTPTDPKPTELIESDRPYAGVFTVSFGYNARERNNLRTSLFTLGMVGPSTHPETIQDFIHDITGSDHFQGWDNQLGDELVFMFGHERSQRLPVEGVWGDIDGFGADAIRTFGLGVGSLATYGSIGGEVRAGWKLPDDFGTSPLRPSGENSAPNVRARHARGWSTHAFASFEGRWMLRDISLDGNTWKNSHSVDREPLVVEAAIGLSVRYSRLKVSFARYFRSREFRDQGERPSYGSFTVSAAF